MPEQKSRYNLRCPACGNTDRFVQIVHFEAHLMDRNLNYIRLLYSEIDHYDCYECGEELDFDIYARTNQGAQNEAV